MRQQVANTSVGVTRQVFQVRADLSTQASDLLRQDDAKFGDQAAQPVVEGGAFFDEALPRAVQAEDDLLMRFLDRYKAHVRPSDRFANRSSIRGVGFAAFTAQTVRGDEFGAMSLTVWPCWRNSRAQ